MPAAHSMENGVNGAVHHKVLGAKHFVRHNPRSDRFDAQCFHHVEFWCARATRICRDCSALCEYVQMAMRATSGACGNLVRCQEACGAIWTLREYCGRLHARSVATSDCTFAHTRIQAVLDRSDAEE